MDHTTDKRIEEQSHTEIAIKTEVEETSPIAHHYLEVSLEINLGHLKEEPGLAQFVKEESGLSVEEEIMADSWPGAGRQGVQATSTCGTVSRTADSVQKDKLDIKNEVECANMDIGPVVLQPVDSYHRKIESSLKPEQGDVPEDFLDILESEDDSGSEVGEFMEASDVDEDEMDIASMPNAERTDVIQRPLSRCRRPLSSSVRSRSRSPLPGTSQRSTPRGQEDERPPLQWDTFGVKEKIVEIDFEEPTSPVNERVAQDHLSRGGLRFRGSRTRAATYALNGENKWRRGKPLIEICVNDEDVPHSLRSMVDEVGQGRMEGREQQRHRKGVRESRERDDESEDELQDQESELRLFHGDRSAQNFDWSRMETFQGSQELFLPETTGPIRKYSSEYEAFRTFWDDDIMAHIVVETNRYAAEISLQSAPFANNWVDTNIHEILILFSFWIMLAIHRMPSVKSCFSNNFLLKTDIFKILMNEQRYWLLTRALHFVDNSTRTPQSSILFCLGPVLDHLNLKFMGSYNPGQDISIGESLMLWKGNPSFKQYVKTKGARFGIRSYELCDTTTGYLWAFRVYTGKTSSSVSPSSFPSNTETVIDLVTPLLHKGYRLFLDNLFNSPLLARYLKRNQTDCIGPLFKTRRNVPSLIQFATIPEGNFIVRHARDVVVLAYQDKKPSYFISTYHGNEMVQIDSKNCRSPHYKPKVIADYNKAMVDVNKKDQMLEPHFIERKRCQDWSMKLFKRLLTVSIINSRILFEKTANDHAKHLGFQLKLVNEIVKRHLGLVPQMRQLKFPNRNPHLSEARLVGQHFIVRPNVGVHRTAGGSRISKDRRYCLWCTTREKRYRRTVYMCDACEVYLCLDECFKNYHTVR